MYQVKVYEHQESGIDECVHTSMWDTYREAKIVASNLAHEIKNSYSSVMKIG